MTKYIDIVFDGPSGPEAPRLIEAEDDTGHSIDLGEWLQRPDGRWVLRLTSLPIDNPHPQGDRDRD